MSFDDRVSSDDMVSSTDMVSSDGAVDGGARPPSPRTLWLVGLAGVAAGASTVVLALLSDHVARPGTQALLANWIMVPYIGAGAVAWWRRPVSRLGPLMIAAGLAMWLGLLQWANDPVLHLIGQQFDMLPAVLFLHVFLAFPTGRLERRIERALVLTGYATAVGFQVAKIMLGVDPESPLVIADAPGAAAVLENVQLFGLSVIMLTGVVVLALGRRRSGRPRRTTMLLIDSFALALVMLATLYVAGALQLSWFELIRLAAFGALGLAPIAFLIALLDARLVRVGVGDLIVRLQADPAPDLRGMLAQALRDPSLALVYWLPQFGTWSDEDGEAVTLPEAGRGKVIIRRGSEPVAALLFDPALEDEPELLDAVGAAAALALENGRLQAELKARLQELHGSRMRVLEAGLKERRRLERDLHDGAQQRLVALSLELALLGESLSVDSDARQRVDRAKQEIAVSLGELRDLARGIYPAVLSGHGLVVALESLTARSAIPVRLMMRFEGRLPEPIEAAAYFVVCESLANAGKHAYAKSVTVEVIRMPEQVVVEVVDDGVGGADTERGSGLRGLADRVEALGGRLRVWSPAEGGTRVKAEIPCG
ncbi:sensor histidine kinase [Actinomadura sp. 6N118]|uniref:sensor histidine kinase n=1 Tax=Actinomadura sp. 6N118 TaxID=3375151 RepID=UPI0037AEC5DA